MITVGGSEAIDIALRAMVNPGDEVLIPQPSYVSYEPCAVLAGAKPVIIPLKAENEFRLTAQELLDAITEKTKILILTIRPVRSWNGKIWKRSQRSWKKKICL